MEFAILILCFIIVSALFYFLAQIKIIHNSIKFIFMTISMCSFLSFMMCLLASGTVYG